LNFSYDNVNRNNSSNFLFQQRLTELHIINPFGTKKVAWDVVCGLALFYSIIEIPFRIGFRTNPSHSALLLNHMVEAIFSADIILTFNTAFVDPMTDLFEADRWLIALQYTSLWLWVDLASTIPFDVIVLAVVSENSAARNVLTIRLIRVLRLVRLVKVIKFVGSRRIKDIIDRYGISHAFASIVSLLLQIFIVAHIVCCFWFFITTPYVTGFDAADRAEVTWVKTFDFADSDVQTQYIASLYWAFATMLTVGYGDIHATNTGERFYASLTMLLGALMFGAIIAKVRVLVESRNLQLKELKARVAEFKAYLEEKRIPNALKSEAKVQSRTLSHCSLLRFICLLFFCMSFFF
jgi:Ion transport protein